MSILVNSVQFIGRISADVEVKTTTNGTKVSNVRLATNEYTRNSQGDLIETTYWHNLVFWGKLAERLKRMCRKGSRLLVQGSLVYREYMDIHNVKREVTDIRVHQFIVLDSPASHDLVPEDATEEETDASV